MNWEKGLIIEKDKDAVKNYDLNLRDLDWLATGDSIDSHTIANVVGVIVDSSTNDGDKITVWLSGGAVGSPARITFRPVTVDGVQDDFTVNFTIIEK